MVETSEKQLVSDWQRGMKAIEELYKRYRSAMYRKAYAILKNEQDAEDEVQDIFTSLLARAWTFDSAKGTFKTWALTVIENDCRAILKQRERTPIISLDELIENGGDIVDPSPGPLEMLIAKEDQEERAELARRALERMTPKQRQAIELKAKGLTGKEIAEEMGIKYDAARYHLSRARRSAVASTKLTEM